MTYTIATNNCFVIDREYPKLISIPSQFTATEVDDLENLIQVIFQEQNFLNKKIIIDFQQTIFIDNKGLIGLCKILRLAKEKNIELRFIDFSPQVKMVLSMTGLEHILPMESQKN